MPTKLIIPSARYIASEMQLDFGLIPPILLPIGNSVALDYILDSVVCDECFIGIQDESKRVDLYIKNKEIDAHLVYVNAVLNTEKNELGYTIAQLIASAELDIEDSLLINFGDTIISKNGLSSDFGQKDKIFCATSDNNFRWSTLNIENDRVKIFDKNRAMKPENGLAICGLFFIKDAKNFASYLSQEIQNLTQDPDRTIDSFYSALENYLNERNFYEIIETADWMDLGHLDTFYQSKAKFLNARHFNSFSIDLFWGKICKKSSYTDKFINEVNWYVDLPDKLKSLIPGIYSHSTKKDDVHLEMEYYGYPTLSQLYLYGNLSISQWSKIFKKLISILSEFKLFSKTVEGGEFKSFYLNKTVDRLDLLRSDGYFDDFFNNEITINGVLYPALNTLIEDLSRFITNFIDDESVLSYVIHGDFCLSNILYDTKIGVLKLIDPRGSFIEPGIFGDLRYDAAKVLHSINGAYDLILTGGYKLDRKDRLDYEMEIYKHEQQKKLPEIYLNLLTESGIDVLQIKAIESLLFLSMVPLHGEDKKRQLAFLLRGIQLYHDLAK